VKRVLALAAAAALPFLAGAVAERYLQRRDDLLHPGLGTLVDIGDGRALHARVMGEQRLGGPTVVFENGMSTTLEAWDWIQTAVSEFATTVSYDRAGLGWSPAGPLPRTAEQTTEDLTRLLDALGVPGPYVLVGHSYGGLLIRHFANRHRYRVAGLVLVDSAHPDQFARSTRQRQSLRMMVSSTGEHARWSRFGFTRLNAERLIRPIVTPLPEPAASTALARMRSSHNWRGAEAETTAWLSSVNDEVRAASIGPNCALAVVTAGAMAEKDPVHGQLQAELACLAPEGRHEVIEGAGHIELITHLDHAQAVVKIIEDVVRQAQEE
jgi:pimeloyl-ACP methyl ester carboxylesterase